MCFGVALLCTRIILYLRLDSALALRRWNKIILVPPGWSSGPRLCLVGALSRIPATKSFLLPPQSALSLALGLPPLEMWPVAKQTQVPFVALSTLEADHGNFLNLGPQPEAFIIRHGAFIRAETINDNSSTRTPQSSAHEGNPVCSAPAGSPSQTFLLHPRAPAPPCPNWNPDIYCEHP